MEFEVTGGPRAPACARQKLATGLAGRIDPGTAHSANLLVSELVTNAVIHGGVDVGGRIRVAAALEDRSLLATVCHPGGGFVPPPDTPDLETPGGLGLYLVDELSESWGIETNGDTCVWFVLGEEDGARRRAFA